MDDKTLRKILKEELKEFATRDDLKNIEKKLNSKIENEVRGSEARLTKVIESEVTDLVGFIGEGFKALDKKLNVTEGAALKVRVSNLEKKG